MASRTSAFKENPPTRVPRSSLDLSHELLATMDFQTLYPVMVKGMIPGDVFKLGMACVLRFNPLVAPILTGIKMRAYSFFVPYRILWDQWEEFITKGANGIAVPTIPTWNPADNAPDSVAIGSLWDFLGFPAGIVPPPEACPVDFPRRAYIAIWNEFFRDETLQTEMALDDTSDYLLLNRNWSKDYFTSALPFQQRGLPVSLPVVGTGNAVFDLPFSQATPTPGTADYRVPAFAKSGALPDTMSGIKGVGTPPYGFGDLSAGETSQMKADMDAFLTDNNTITGTAFSSVDIADLRLAFKMQELMEANARGGARYTEWLQHIFGVSPTDARLQRPEYIGGLSQPVIISEVLQTSSTDSEPTPQGTLAGHGIGIVNDAIGSYRCEEFGLVMTVFCLTAESLYQQGTNREWLRRTAYDYPVPQFYGLSEQEIFNAEIFTVDVASDPDGSINLDLFGYTGRFNEERFMASRVAGLMRSTFAYWTQSRIFASMPTLDATFISTPPRKDILAVPAEPACVVRIGNKVDAYRPIPFMPVPVRLGGV